MGRRERGHALARARTPTHQHTSSPHKRGSCRHASSFSNCCQVPKAVHQRGRPWRSWPGPERRAHGAPSCHEVRWRHHVFLSSCTKKKALIRKLITSSEHSNFSFQMLINNLCFGSMHPPDQMTKFSGLAVPTCIRAADPASHSRFAQASLRQLSLLVCAKPFLLSDVLKNKTIRKVTSPGEAKKKSQTRPPYASNPVHTAVPIPAWGPAKVSWPGSV